MRTIWKNLVIALLAIVVFAGAAVFWWSGQPLGLKQNTAEFSVEPGDDAEAVTKSIIRSGVGMPTTLLGAWLSWTGQSGRFKVGSYELRKDDTPRTLLRKLVRGEFGLKKFRIGEGWNMRQLRTALLAADGMKNESAGLSDAALLKAIGGDALDSAEGMFFPDTYKYAKNTSDLDILRLAHQTMQRKLESA